MRFEDDGGFAFRFAWMTTRPTLCLHAGVGRGQASKPHQQCTGWRGGAGLSAPQRTARDAVRPDLAILDLNLPRKDGRAVLAEAKADKTLRTVPLVVFSTSRSTRDIARSYELGANCYVHKPGNLEDYFFAVLRMNCLHR